ncbi:MAG: hypothetical protein R3C12_10290 [Planctomycetaceae bacterium]
MKFARNCIVPLVLWIWVGPWNVLGLLLGCGSLLTGGRGNRRGRTLEFHGGLADWLLRCTPVDAIAITLGHVILGRTAAALEITRSHELVHVKQYERWGPLFVPVYFLLSAVVWFQGRMRIATIPSNGKPFPKARPATGKTVKSD